MGECVDEGVGEDVGAGVGADVGAGVGEAVGEGVDAGVGGVGAGHVMPWHTGIELPSKNKQLEIPLTGTV